MTRMLQEGEAALARTPELMAVLKEAGVVDAGGKGFVRMLEGVVRLIEGDPILPVGDLPDSEEFAPAALVEVAAERDFQFCTEVMVEGSQLPSVQRGPGGPPQPGRLDPGRGVGRPPEAARPYRHARGGLHPGRALGNGRHHQGRGHAGPAPRAGAWGPPSCDDRHRQLLRSPRWYSRQAPHRDGAAAGDVRRPDLPRPGGTPPRGVLPPDAGIEGPPHDLPAARLEASCRPSATPGPRRTR